MHGRPQAIEATLVAQIYDMLTRGTQQLGSLSGGQKVAVGDSHDLKPTSETKETQEARPGRSALFRDGVDALADRQRERALDTQLDRQDPAVKEADQPARLLGGSLSL